MVSYGTANNFLDLEELITEVNVAIERRVNLKDMMADADELKSMVSKTFPDLAAATFMDNSAEFLELAKGKRAFNQS